MDCSRLRRKNSRAMGPAGFRPPTGGDARRSIRLFDSSFSIRHFAIYASVILPDTCSYLSARKLLMAIGIRTQDLRKTYSSPPPLGAGGGFIARADAKAAKQPKTQIAALNGVSLDVAPGEIFCLLGPNGAGKSTSVGILTTRVRPSGGQAWIGEHEVWKDPVAVKHLIGVVPQRPNLDFSLTAGEILTFHGAYFGLGTKERNGLASSLLEKFKLTDRANQMVRGFSGGMMQRLSIARAMMHDPKVLFLDEPSAGLDPQTRILLWEIIREYHQAGKTILLTTHNMEEADALCQRLAIIDHGRGIALGTPANLKASIPGGYLPPAYKSLLLPGIIAISMVFTG